MDKFAHIKRLNPDIIQVSNAEITLREEAKEGEGTIRWQVKTSCCSVRLPKSPIEWLKEKTCADGLIFQDHPDYGLVLHVVELKSTIDGPTWQKIKKQWCGGYLNGLAMSAIMENGPIQRVVLHLAHKLVKISQPHKQANSATLKRPAGQGYSNTVADWQCKHLSLWDDMRCPVFYYRRDDDGNATLGVLPVSHSETASDIGIDFD